MQNFKEEMEKFASLHPEDHIEYRDGVFTATIDGRMHRFDYRSLKHHNRARARFLENLPRYRAFLEIRGFTLVGTAYEKGKNLIVYKDPFGQVHTKIWAKIRSLGDSASGIPRIGEKICQALIRRMCPAHDWVNNRRYPFLQGLELDCYSESLALALEHQGQQHFEKIGKQSREEFEALRERDRRKKRLLEKRGIRLLEITQGHIGVHAYYGKMKEALERLGISHVELDEKELEETSDFVHEMVKGWYESYTRELLEHMEAQNLAIDRIEDKPYDGSTPVRPHFSIAYHCKACGWKGSLKKLKAILENRSGCQRCRTKYSNRARFMRFVDSHPEKLAELGIAKEDILYDTKNKGQIALRCPRCGNLHRNLSQKAFLALKPGWCRACERAERKRRSQTKRWEKAREKASRAYENRMSKIRQFFPDARMVGPDTYWCGNRYDDGTPHPVFHVTLAKLSKELNRPEKVNLQQLCYGCHPRQGSMNKTAGIVRQILDAIDREYNPSSRRTRTPDILDPVTGESLPDSKKISTSREKYLFQCSDASHPPYYGTMSNYLNLSKHGYCKACAKRGRPGLDEREGA